MTTADYQQWFVLFKRINQIVGPFIFHSQAKIFAAKDADTVILRKEYMKPGASAQAAREAREGKKDRTATSILNDIFPPIKSKQ